MKLSLSLCGLFVVVVTTCTVNSYDFHDSAFNNLLSSYWHEVDAILEIDHNDLGRFRRDEEAVKSSKVQRCHHKLLHRGLKLCCGEDLFRLLKDNVKDVSRKCFKYVTGLELSDKETRHFDLFSCEAVQKRKSDMICIQQCKGQELGLLNEDGAPIEEHLTAFFKENFADSLVSEEMVKNCMATTNRLSEYSMKYHAKGSKTCNPFAVSFIHCLFQQILLNCPEDQIKDKESCQKLQAKMLQSGENHHGSRRVKFVQNT